MSNLQNDSKFMEFVNFAKEVDISPITNSIRRQKQAKKKAKYIKKQRRRKRRQTSALIVAHHLNKEINNFVFGNK